MIGIDVQPRRPCTTSMPSMPGRPRSTIAASCTLRRATRQRRFARLDEIDLVAACLEVRAERTQQRTLVVDDQDALHDAHSSASVPRLQSGDR